MIAANKQKSLNVDAAFLDLNTDSTGGLLCASLVAAGKHVGYCTPKFFVVPRHCLGHGWRQMYRVQCDVEIHTSFQAHHQGGQPGKFSPKLKKNIFKSQKTFWLLGKTSLCNHIPPPNISAGCDPAPFQRRIVGVY